MNIPLVMMALVAGGTLNCRAETRQRNETVTMTLCLLHILRETHELTSSAANLSTAVKGVFSGTLRLRVGQAIKATWQTITCSVFGSCV